MKRILYPLLCLLCLLCLLLCACERMSIADPPDSSAPDTAEHTHVYSTSFVLPSCTDGYTIYTCKTCGHSYTDGYVEAIGHRYVSELADTTCDKYRCYTHTCEVCGYSYTSETDLLGTHHTMEMVGTVPPSHENGGYTLYICKHCKRTEQRDHTAPTGFSVGLTYAATDGGVCVTGIGSCNDTKIVIPSVNEHGENVVAIASAAFAGHSQINRIRIPDTVRWIGERAFSRCTGLTLLEIPKNTSVGMGAFEWCSKLEFITMPLEHSLGYYFENSTPPSTLKGLYVTALKSTAATLSCAEGLVSVTLSDQITAIPPYFFYNCKSLKNIFLPTGLLRIGSYAFSNTPITEFTLPSGVTVLRESTFAGCTELNRVTLHTALRGIESNVFEGCTALRSIDLPDSLNTIRKEAFRGSGLTSISLPSSIVSLSDGLFLDCKSLCEINLHDGIVSIGSCALDGTAITSFVYPQNLSTPILSLERCTRLTSITFEENLKQFPRLSGCTALESITVPEGVTVLDVRTFENCTALKEVRLPTSLREIGESAFAGCSSLRSITVPNGVSKIGDRAFLSCTALTSVTLPEGLTEIGSSLFSKCSALRSIDLPDALTKIGYRAFSESGLREIELPARIRLTAESVFAGCPDLERVTLHTPPTPYCFENCASLRRVTIGEGIVMIPRFAFRNCTALEELKLPLSLQTIQYEAFGGCIGLSELTVPQNVTMIDFSAFSGCTAITDLTLLAKHCTSSSAFSALETLTVGEGVETIPARLCANAKLRELVLPDSVQSIGNGAFSGCTQLEQVSLPTSLKTIDTDAFRQAGLTSLSINSPCLAVGASAFLGCEQLRTVDFKGATVTLGNKAFANCNALEELAGTENVTVPKLGIFPDPFYQTQNALITCLSSLVAINAEEIESTVAVPEGIRFIAPEVFRGCNIIKSITLPSTLREIGDYAFANCTRLREIEIPNRLEKLGVGVFSGCTALESLTLPDGLAELPSLALANCTALYELSLGSALLRIAPDAYIAPTQTTEPQRMLYTLHYRGTAADWARVELGANNPLSTCTVVCTDQTIRNVLYQGTIYNSDCSYTVFSDHTLVLYGEGEFSHDFAHVLPSHFQNVRRLVISEGITSVEDLGFSIFQKLEEIELASTVTAFPIDHLTHTPWYETHRPLETGFFIDNGRLFDVSTELAGAVTLPDGITMIGGYAFSGCTEMTELHIPEGVISIETSAFRYCYALQNPTLPQSLQTLGTFPFYECNAITKLVIPKNVTSVGGIAVHCDQLQSITFMGSTEIANFCALYCDELAYICFGEGLTTFPSNTISDCPGLRAIVIPESLTSVHEHALISVGTPMLCFRSASNAESITEAINASRPNAPLTAYLYSALPPEEDGNWWHFDEHGFPVAY